MVGRELMSHRLSQIPNPRTEWLWAFLPWGLLLGICAVGCLATGAYGPGFASVVAWILVCLYLLHLRRTIRQNWLRVDPSGVTLCVKGKTQLLAFDDIGHIDWIPGTGSPMYSATSTSPRVRFIMRDGSIHEVEIFFAKSWREVGAAIAFREAVAPLAGTA